jgi:hypothetical protein
MKKILLALLLTGSLFAKSSIYLDKNDYSNNDFRVFVGLDAKYGYLNSKRTSDQTIYSIGGYVGLPFFGDYEFIINKNKEYTRDYTLDQQSITFNIPLTSRQSRRVYVGLKAGTGTVSFDDSDDIDNKFYAIHIGKRYKFTRHYRVRIELEAISYDIDDNLGSDNGITFNYGFEYRF